MKNKKYEPRITLGELISSSGRKIPEIADRMNVERTQVMAWVCGEVPDALSAIRLAEILGEPLTRVYLSILRTPNLMT